jgi:probable rRNA maturation factor
VDPGSKLRVSVTDGRGRPVADHGLARWLARVAPAAARGSVAVALVTDARMRELNHAYRHTDDATDVLSFSADLAGTMGDIVIATGVARRQAREAGHPFGTELRVLALHGLLHLLGYDHDAPRDRGRMVRAEARLRRRGGLGAGLIERGTDRRPPSEAKAARPKAARARSARKRAGVGPREH